jgi:quercetin dioxygenase-like cupin family protein
VTQFGSFDRIDVERPYEGIERRVLATAKATVQEYSFKPGATFPLHRHPQEQLTLVLEGELSFTAGGEAHPLTAGSWSVVPGDADHGITAGSAGARFLAILVPPRKEPLP